MIRRALPASLLALGVIFAVALPALAQPASQPASAAPPRVTLPEALRRALAQNPSLAVARADLARAEALVRQARASSFPTLVGGVTYTRLEGDRLRGETVVAHEGSTNANVALTVPLVQAQRWASWSHAKDNVMTSRASAEEVRRQVAVAVARTYLAVVAQHRVIEVNERARDTSAAHLDFARRRFAGGAGNRLTVVQSEQELASNQAQVEVAHGAMARVREALGVLLGESGPVDSVPEAALAPPPSVEDALRDLQARRTDLRLARERVRAAQRTVKDSWTDFMPSLTGVFLPFFQDPASFSQPRTGWQAQLLLSVPLYDGGLRYGQQRERRALLASAQAAMDGILRQARAEVRSAFATLQRVERALQSAQRAARLANEAYTLVNRAYEAGATTHLEIIDALRRAHDSATAAVVAEDSARQARLDLLIATGRFP